MGGRDDAGRLLGGEQFGEAGHGLRPTPAVQQQEGAALAAVVDGDADRPGTVRADQ